ncbi:MAG: MATE family efflux transporter, partial [Firmicutes bacterium]|nr:MATE family efflux transporter [Bacillota bacterium]
LGAKIIRSFALGMPVLAAQMLLMSMFQALGKGVQSLVISLGRQGFFYVPFLAIFSTQWGFNGFIRALPAADVATTLLSLTLFYFLRQELQGLPRIG